jgi:hypothetical protein
LIGSLDFDVCLSEFPPDTWANAQDRSAELFLVSCQALIRRLRRAIIETLDEAREAGGAKCRGPANVAVAIRSLVDPGDVQAVILKSAPQERAAAGVYYVIRTDDITSLYGTPSERFVLIALDGVEKTQGWQKSAPHKEFDTSAQNQQSGRGSQSKGAN